MKTKTVLVGVAFGIAMAAVYLNSRATRQEVALLRGELARISLAAQESAEAVPRLVPVPVPVPSARERATLVSPSASVAEEKERTAPPPDPARRKPPTRIESFAPIRDGLEAVFQSERVDASWADGARSIAENGLASRLPEGSRLGVVECRTTVCRVESVHDSQLQASKFSRDTFADHNKRPWKGSYATGLIAEDKTTGQVTMVTFLLRESAELPLMEDPLAVAGK
jgi:hypothetical protein